MCSCEQLPKSWSWENTFVWEEMNVSRRRCFPLGTFFPGFFWPNLNPSPPCSQPGRSVAERGMGWEKENGWRAAGMENLTRVSFATSWKCLSEGRNGGGLMLVGSVCGLTRPHMHAYTDYTHTHVCIEPSLLSWAFPWSTIIYFMWKWSSVLVLFPS